MFVDLLYKLRYNFSLISHSFMSSFRNICDTIANGRGEERRGEERRVEVGTAFSIARHGEEMDAADGARGSAEENGRRGDRD